MSDYYILKEDHTTEPCEMLDWAMWASSNREKLVVKQETVNDVKVSTVFIGLNHAFLGQGAPLIFETMIFGGPHDQYQERYCTWEEAEEGHERALKLAKKSIEPPNQTLPPESPFYPPS